MIRTKGTTIKVTLYLDLPVDADDALIARWLRFYLLEEGDIPAHHPLTDNRPDAQLDWYAKSIARDVGRE